MTGFKQYALIGRFFLNGQTIDSMPSFIAKPDVQVDAERRQMTVMFVDMVGSTQRARNCDPEDYYDFNLRFLDMVRQNIEDDGGYVARVVGDGVLAFFGWPKARETDPVRAIRAAKKIVEQVSSIIDPSGQSASCRVGIATGTLIVDGITAASKKFQEVFGEIPNLANELQEMGTENSIIVSDITRHLVEKEYYFRAIESPNSNGRTDGSSGAGFMLMGERHKGDDTIAPLGWVKFVGRAEELSFLDQQWQASSQGKGRVVWIEGEAGIGKSQLMKEILRRWEVVPQHCLKIYGSRYHTTSPFYPIVESLTRLAGVHSEDDFDTQREKIKALLAKFGVDADERLVQRLLGDSPKGERIFMDGVDADNIALVRTLVELFAKISESHPLVVIFENFHWADPSTVAMTTLFLRSIAHLPILFLVTYRMDISPPELSEAHWSVLRLGTLSQADCEEIAKNIAGNTKLSDKALSIISTKTQGVPLYVEAYTRSLIEQGGQVLTQTGFMGRSDVPFSLHDSLMERLDRLEEAKPIAQICAAMGREFDLETITAICDDVDMDVAAVLQRLVGADILNVRHEGGVDLFYFSHTLLQDAAYQGMLKRKRRHLHNRIARHLLKTVPQIADINPAIIAEHFRVAENYSETLVYLQKAAQRAYQRFGNQEVVELCDQAIVLCRKLANPLDKDKTELEFQSMRAHACRALYGAAQSQTMAAYRRMLELSTKLEITDRKAAAIKGLFNGFNAEGHYDEALLMAERMIEDGHNNPVLRMIGHHMRGVPLIWKAEFLDAVDAFETACQLNKAQLDQDAKSLQHLHQINTSYALVCAFLGQANKAKTLGQNALDYALIHDSHMEIANCYISLCNVLRIVRSKDAPALAQAFGRYVKDFEIPYYSAAVNAFLGIGKFWGGEQEKGLLMLEQGWAEFAQTRSRINQVFYQVELVECYLHIGQLGDAKNALDAGFRFMSECGERNFEAELHRLKAQLLAKKAEQVGDQDQTRAILMEFERAIFLARWQQAKTFELRASVQRIQYGHSEGMDVTSFGAELADLVDSIDPNEDLADLAAAKMLLA